MRIAIPLFILLIVGSLPNDAVSDTSMAPLFESDEVLELSMKVNFKKLCRPRETPDCEYKPSTLIYFEDRRQRKIPIEIKIRGGWRALSSNCIVPLLFIRFPGEKIAGTPFEGQSSLPLTTHCGRTSPLMGYSKYVSYEQYLLKEYLAYRLYNQMTDTSLRTRLARITYEDPEKPDRTFTYYAFFTEHFKSLVERKQAELLSRGSFDHQVLDRRAADIVALFQFMIGNTDWSIVRQRNTILIQLENGIQVPVPYDLDMSGLVNAPYAGPPPTLPIREVTDRYYLGFCHPGIDWDGLFDEFLSRQETLLALPGEIPGLYRREQKSVRNFLRAFFKILNSPGKRETKIINACHPWPPSPIDHMTPAKKKS